MASTGEVAAFGTTLAEAYWTSLTSTNGFRIPQAKSGVLIGGDVACPQMATVAKGLSDLGFKLYCSSPIVEEHLNSLPYISKTEKIFFPVKDKRKLREVFDEVSRNFLCSRQAEIDFLMLSSTLPTVRHSIGHQSRCRSWSRPTR